MSIEPPALTPDEQVIANSYVVQEAVDAFAEGNSGFYAWNASSNQNEDGNTVQNLLEGASITNPFTGDPIELYDGPAATPGQIGYYSVSPHDYVISGFGENDTVIKLRSAGPVESDDPVWATITIHNALLLRDAAAAYFVENGVYPRYGDDLMPFLPGGEPPNPYTGAPYSMINGGASNPGEIGYQENVDQGQTVGYIITAAGLSLEFLMYLRTP